jgi:hypothetical protein
LGVGDSLDIVYPLPGPVPAGTYLVDVYGAQTAKMAQVHFDLLWRPQGGSDQNIASVDGKLATTDDAGIANGSFGAIFDAPAISAQCDDLLVVRVKMLSGSPFLEVFSTLEVP